ncbi:MAG: HAMP domain-containing histidine kinase [Anaerolineales bacterium]|nr:HAMP domain-containing histidine kinase [Anaerolineales bacterium]
MEFVSKEAHDLKSPFNRALGFVKLVLKGMDGPISDQAREDLTVAYQNGMYALFMMSGLVEMARLVRGERVLSLAECRVDHLLGQMIADWKRQSTREKAAKVTFSAPACTVTADDALIRQCLSNWVSYVAEFTGEEAQIDIQAIEQPETCLFTIRSNGKKLQPPSECDLTIYGYIAQSILDLHGGKLLRAEEDEQGALIQLALPKS